MSDGEPLNTPLVPGRALEERLSPTAVRRVAELLVSIDCPRHQIGPYHLLEILGTGGMGVVYRAEQTHPIKRTVALKLIKPGMDSRDVIARFESERQALAMMSHKNVAKVLDAGTSDDGRPYFVMEHVPGLPITAYCDKHRLTLKQRLELFIQACEAVQHAHQKAILHRDIKPSNILVTGENGDTEVKVIDFGVAKALSPTLDQQQTLYTHAGQMLGTPEYMSPEQAGSDGQHVDTRSDIYSLGVVLYELITGALPFDPKTLRSSGVAEIQRIIREVDPPRPSTRLSTLGETASEIASNRATRLDTLHRELRGELEWIPLKAMRKEPDRRYTSAQELADDIHNYLERKPLLAGPESRIYRTKKFLLRHRAGVAASAAMILLLSTGITSYIHSIRAEQAKTLAALKEAQNRQKQTEAVVGFLTDDVFANAGPDNLPDKAVRDLIFEKMIEPAIARIDVQFKDDPLTLATVQTSLAKLLDSLGRFDEAEPLYKAALDRRRRVLGEDHPDTIETLIRYTFVQWSLGRALHLEPLHHEALERARRVLGDDHPNTILSLGNYAFVLRSLGRWTEAELLLRETLDRSRRVLGEDHPDTIRSLIAYSLVLRSLGKGRDAESHSKEAMERSRRVMGEDHPTSLTALHVYAYVLRSIDRWADAEPLAKEALERRARVLGDDHLETMKSLDYYAYVVHLLGRSSEAEPLFKVALERRRRVLGEDHPDTITSLNNYATVLESLGRLPEAAPLLREALTRNDRVLGEDHPHTIRSMNRYAHVLHSLGRLNEAEPLYRESVARSVNSVSFGAEHAETKRYAADHADCLDALRRPQDAAAVREQFRLPASTSSAANTPAQAH